MLARVARVGQENPCKAGPAYLCSRQVLRPGQGYQLARVAMGGAWAGLWVAVSPHKGHKGRKPARGKPKPARASSRNPWACCCKPGPSLGECYRIIRLSTASFGG